MTPNSPSPFRTASPSQSKHATPADRRVTAPASPSTAAQPLEPKWEAAIGQATD